MKKLISISLSLIILLGLMHVSIATHYCGGELAASKISLTGLTASCGMENAESSCPIPGDKVKSHCCDDEVSVYSINTDFAPSYSGIKIPAQKILQVYYIPVNTFHSLHSSGFNLIDLKPPGNLLASAVSLVDICVFRN